MAVAVVVAAVVIAAAVTAYSASAQADQQRSVAKFNQKVAENEALARRQAGQIEAQNLRKKQQLIMASQRAGIGASGVLPSEGSPLLVQDDSSENAALNEARVRYNAEVGARQADSEAIIQRYYRRIANTNEKIGYTKAGVTLLTGVAGAYANAASRGGDAGYSTSPGYQSYRAGERLSY